MREGWRAESNASELEVGQRVPYTRLPIHMSAAHAVKYLLTHHPQNFANTLRCFPARPCSHQLRSMQIWMQRTMWLWRSLKTELTPTLSSSSTPRLRGCSITMGSDVAALAFKGRAYLYGFVAFTLCLLTYYIIMTLGTQRAFSSMT